MDPATSTPAANIPARSLTDIPDVGDASPAAVVGTGAPARIVHVATARPYDVTIGAGASRLLSETVRGAAQVALLHPAPLATVAHRLAAELGDVRVLTIEVPGGEAAKTPEVLVDCWNRLAEHSFTRNDVVVGLGGGSTTDLAGFVAASFLRGIDFVSVPTTVLAMVDAAVGGKTGINLPAGKNLVGAFWEPRAVLCDLSLLRGLPDAEVSSGLAEVAKAGFSHDPGILELIEGDPADARDVTSTRFAELVRRGVEHKARVVAGDLREATSTASSIGREGLNYGHTLAHAIEAFHHFGWRHGDAVAVGMVFVAEVSQRLLGLPADQVQRHRDVLASLGLPTRYGGREGDAGYEQLRAIMARDKKARGNTLRLIGLRRIGELALLEGPDEQPLREAFAALRA